MRNVKAHIFQKVHIFLIYMDAVFFGLSGALDYEVQNQ